ncbi:MAG: START domain-containing protein [Bacteroidota bacterium]
MKSLFILFSSFLLLFPGREHNSDRTAWKLKKVKDGITVFTRDLPNTNLKELKIDLIMEHATLSKIITILGDTEAYTKWVYNLLDSKKLHRLNQRESYDYFALDFPWPLSNRELYTKSTYSQNRKTKVLTILTEANLRYAGKANDMVRMTEHRNKWLLEPISKDQVRITYFLNSNPSGNIPNWAVNMALDYGPISTMNALRQRLEHPKYRDFQPLEWIVEY